MITIDFNKEIDQKIRIISGRDKGEKLRKKFDISTLDKKDEIIEIIIPSKFYSFNSSYFLGCFGPSVRKFGKENFKTRFIFKCDDIIMKNINDGIEEALKTSNLLEE